MQLAIVADCLSYPYSNRGIRKLPELDSAGFTSTSGVKLYRFGRKSYRCYAAHQLLLIDEETEEQLNAVEDEKLELIRQIRKLEQKQTRILRKRQNHFTQATVKALDAIIKEGE